MSSIKEATTFLKRVAGEGRQDFIRDFLGYTLLVAALLASFFPAIVLIVLGSGLTVTGRNELLFGLILFSVFFSVFISGTLGLRNCYHELVLEARGDRLLAGLGKLLRHMDGASLRKLAGSMIGLGLSFLFLTALIYVGVLLFSSKPSSPPPPKAWVFMVVGCLFFGSLIGAIKGIQDRYEELVGSGVINPLIKLCSVCNKTSKEIVTAFGLQNPLLIILDVKCVSRCPKCTKWFCVPHAIQIRDPALPDEVTAGCPNCRIPLGIGADIKPAVLGESGMITVKEKATITCDLCSDKVASVEKRYSASQVQQAVRAGLRPTGTSDLFANLIGMPQEDADAGWVQMVMRDTTDWAVCPACASRIEQNLKPAQHERAESASTARNA